MGSSGIREVDMNLISAVAVLAVCTVSFSACAQMSPPQSGSLGIQSAAPVMIEGEVRKVDKEQGKITLKHGPIPNLEMPGMTMVFRVKEPAMLERVQAGDKVRFAADKLNGQITVTSIEVTK